MSSIAGGVWAAGIDGGVAAGAVLGGVEIGGVVIRDGDRPPYEGEYSATPSNVTQRFSTKNRRMTEDFTVNPIPGNYGLITWDGSVLTVS